MKTGQRKKVSHTTTSQTQPANQASGSSTSLDVATPIKLRHLLVLLGLGIVVLALISLALESYWQRKQPVFQDAPRLVAALQAYSRDRFIKGLKMPASVSLTDLVAGGFLTTNDISAFQGIEVTITPAATNENNPQQPLIRAKLPDGSVIALLADGSVQQVPSH